MSASAPASWVVTARGSQVVIVQRLAPSSRDRWRQSRPMQCGDSVNGSLISPSSFKRVVGENAAAERARQGDSPLEEKYWSAGLRHPSDVSLIRRRPWLTRKRCDQRARELKRLRVSSYPAHPGHSGGVALGVCSADLAELPGPMRLRPWAPEAPRLFATIRHGG